jgi:GNAT superfamily N-acetyltransferase
VGAGDGDRLLEPHQLGQHLGAADDRQQMLTRGDVHDPVLEGHLITVPEVRMSADLRLATIYVIPLGGKDIEAVLEALEQWAVELGFDTLRLETGDRLLDAIRLYERAGYRRGPCWGPYLTDPKSVCYQKHMAAS